MGTMSGDWVVVDPKRRWDTRCGRFTVAKVATSDWRLTEIVRDWPGRIVALEFDRRFNCPNEAVLYVRRLLDQRRRGVATVVSEDIIGCLAA